MLEGEWYRFSETRAVLTKLFRGATPETVKKAFEILIADPKVKSIFINIFGGMSHIVHLTCNI